jgi:uncharacterized protein YndB with AHSA1/START domain
MSEPTPDLTFEADLDHAPETVWRALAEPALRDAWLPANDVGAPGEVLAADEPNSLSIAWRDAADDRDSVVTFVLRPSPAGTHLTVTHGGVSAEGRLTMKLAA